MKKFISYTLVVMLINVFFTAAASAHTEFILAELPADELYYARTFDGLRELHYDVSKLPSNGQYNAKETEAFNRWRHDAGINHERISALYEEHPEFGRVEHNKVVKYGECRLAKCYEYPCDTPVQGVDNYGIAIILELKNQSDIRFIKRVYNYNVVTEKATYCYIEGHYWNGRVERRDFELSDNYALADYEEQGILIGMIECFLY